MEGDPGGVAEGLWVGPLAGILALDIGELLGLLERLALRLENTQEWVIIIWTSSEKIYLVTYTVVRNKSIEIHATITLYQLDYSFRYKPS